MTAAFGELTGPALRGRAGRFLCVLALVLPVPLFAALGLSLPLPATVERIAAKLVPFGDAGALDSNTFAVGARGSIALAPGERHRTEGDTAASVGSAAVQPESRTAGKSDLSATPVTGVGPRTDADENAAASTGGQSATTSPSTPQLADAPSAVPSKGGGDEEETQSGGGGGSDPGSAPTIVDTATNTANGAVETVATVTESPGDTTKEAVDSVTDAGAGALGGVKPP